MVKKRFDIIIAGASFADHNKFISNFPEKGMLASIHTIENHVGGCVSNTSIALKKIDPNLKVKVYTSIGKDNDGKLILEQLSQNQIDISDVQTSREKHTGFTDVYTDVNDGARTFFTFNGANDLLTKEDIMSNLESSNIFHIGYVFLMKQLDKFNKDYGTNLAELLKYVQDRGIKTSIDLVSKDTPEFNEVVLPSLKYCNYLIINELEGSMITGIKIYDSEKKMIEENIFKILKSLIDLGVQDVAVIHSPQGGWAMDKEYTLHFEPSFKVSQEDISSTVGAGDAFCAGMLYSINKKFTLAHSLRIANGAAATSLFKADSVSGIGNIQELNNLENSRK